MSNTAPELFQAKFETSKGEFIVEINRGWAPKGADRLHELLELGFFEQARFFRVLEDFVAQFGINADPKVASEWRSKTIPDDPKKESNRRGTLTFATAGPNTRTTQLFINFKDNTFLDSMGFSPIGQITTGMDVVDSLHSAYGEGAPSGNGPDQGKIQAEGNAYLERDFPKLDFIKKAYVLNEG